jgi:hypothetical protein
LPEELGEVANNIWNKISSFVLDEDEEEFR